MRALRGCCECLDRTLASPSPRSSSSLDQLSKWLVAGPLELQNASGRSCCCRSSTSPGPRITASRSACPGAERHRPLAAGRDDRARSRSASPGGSAARRAAATRSRSAWCSAARSAISSTGSASAMSSTSPTCISATSGRFLSSMSPTPRLASASSSCCCAPSSRRRRAPEGEYRTCVRLSPRSCCSALALGGCAMLSGKQHAPDEFAVARNAPLVIPPDYSLTPPVAGTVGLSPRTPRPRRSRPCSAAPRRAARPRPACSTAPAATARARRPLDRRRPRYAGRRQGPGDADDPGRAERRQQVASAQAPQ